MNFFAISALANAFSSFVAGVFIFRSCPTKGLRWTYIFFCISVFWWSIFYFFWQMSTQHGHALLFCRLLMLGAIFVPVSNLHHLIILLNAQKRYATLLRSIYLLDLLWVIITPITPLIVKTVSPISSFRYWPMAGLLFTPFLVSFAFTVFFAIYLIISHLFVAKGGKKAQLFYLLVGTLIGWSGAATNFPLWYGIGIRPVGNILVSGYLFCVGYAIIKHRLMDITVIIRKTLIYSVVTGALTAIYLIVVTVFARIFQGVAGYQTVLSSAAAAGVIAILFQPIRKKVQNFVDRKFFRQYVDRDEKLYELSREIVTHTTAEAMAQALLKVLAETLHPKRAAFYLRAPGGSGFAPAGAFGCSGLELVPEGNALATYLASHSQPFVQDAPKEAASSMDTRNLVPKERKSV